MKEKIGVPFMPGYSHSSKRSMLISIFLYMQEDVELLDWLKFIAFMSSYYRFKF